MSSSLLFVRLSQATILIPVIVGLVRFKRLNKIQRVLASMVLISLLTECIGLLMFYFGENRQNVVVYNIYGVIQFILINRIYARALEKRVSTVGMNLLLLVYILFAIFNTVFFQPLNTFNSNSIALASLIYICYAILYFYKLLKEPTLKALEYNETFWLSTGMLLYNSGALMLFFLINYIIVESQAATTAAWGLNNIFNILLNGFYAIALWVNHKA